MWKLDYTGAIALIFILTVKRSFGVEPLKTRLVGGSGPHEGRVEVFYQGEWGTVCDDGWDINDAHVVCRSLGFARALTYNRRAAFGQGTGPIVLSELSCDRHDRWLKNLAYCRHSGYLTHTCTHLEDAGVVCEGADPLPTRLEGGNGPHEGRVEVFYDGAWGTVCDDIWDINDAHVVCRTLGYERASASFMNAAFGEGTGDIILDDVQCLGTEPNLAYCRFHDNGYRVHNCGHEEDAGVACEGFGTSVRLQDGSGSRDGRVEVLYNGTWGTVCDDQFHLEDAHVVCKMLGFSHAESVSYEVPGGTGDIIVDDLECAGTEMRIQDCPQKAVGTHNCIHEEDVGVTCVELPVRLVGSSNPNEGRVELFREGSWGTICDDQWDILDAEVVCRMLGYPTATGAPTHAAFGEGADDILLTRLQCNGDETHITQCGHQSLPQEQSSCSHSEDAGVVCGGKGDFRARLADGPDAAQGRVELFYYGAWGTACHLGWTSADSQVLCKMLGYPGALDTAYHSAYGPGAGMVLLRQPQCTGKESSLMDCNAAKPIGETECDHSMDVGVTCMRPNDLQVRLVGSQSRNEGRVEVNYGGSWGTVCDDRFDLNDANVVCRMLGYHQASNYSCCGGFGQGSDPLIALDEVECTGTESNLGHCMRGVLGVHDCTHAEDVGVTCSGSDPNALMSKKSAETSLYQTLSYGLLGGLGFLVLVFLALSMTVASKMKSHRAPHKLPLKRRPVVRHVSKSNPYGGVPPVRVSRGLYPSLVAVKDVTGKVPAKGADKGSGKGSGKGSDKGKSVSKGKDKSKADSGKPMAVVVKADDSNKGMLMSLKEKLKMSH